VQSTESPLGHQQHLPDDRRGVLDLLEAFRRMTAGFKADLTNSYTW
jgi:hypothetical protein